MQKKFYDKIVHFLESRFEFFFSKSSESFSLPSKQRTNISMTNKKMTETEVSSPVINVAYNFL